MALKRFLSFGLGFCLYAFTLPYEIRSLARDNQTILYNLLFAYASSTLKDFGLNPKNLGANIGMTAILHTHNRRLDYHPHIHVMVIPENNIVSSKDGYVAFTYAESRTGKTRYRTLKGEDFLWLVLQHVLPKGFRRVRDYGFLHGNAKKLLSLVQMVLQVLIETCTPRPRPVFKCPRCWVEGSKGHPPFPREFQASIGAEDPP